jgi:hypothetical protein
MDGLLHRLDSPVLIRKPGLMLLEKFDDSAHFIAQAGNPAFKIV